MVIADENPRQVAGVGPGGDMPGIEAIRPLDQPSMSAAKHLLGPIAGALALRAWRQTLGCRMIFVARCGDGLAAEAENAQRAYTVANPSC